MRPVTVLQLIAVVALLAPSLPHVGASAGSSPNGTITIAQGNGMYFAETLEMNGTSTQSMANVDWYLFDAFSENSSPLMSGNLSSVRAASNDKWEWNLEVDIQAFDCTCQVVLVDDNQPIHHGESRIVYLGSANHVPFVLPFPLQHADRQYFLLSNADLLIDVPLVLPSHSFNETYIAMDYCKAPVGENCDDEMVRFVDFQHTTTDGIVSLLYSLDSVDLHDGHWQFSITVSDTLLQSSNTEFFRLLVDRNVPEVVLSSDAQPSQETVNESSTASLLPEVFEDEPISFSALVDDGYFGGEHSLTWTVIEPDGKRRALADSEFVSESIISVRPHLSGVWTAELLVRDEAGWLLATDIQFVVLNEVPIVHVELDSLVIAEDAVIALDANEQWVLDSSKSTDTASDNTSLSHTWYVNGNTFLTGKTTLDHTMFPNEGTYSLRVVVEDDNGASSELNFRVDISDGSDGVSDGSLSTSFAIALLVICGVVVSLLFMYGQRNSTESVLPRWKSPTSDGAPDYDDSSEL